VTSALREALGDGHTVDCRIEEDRPALMPVVALLAVFPLGLAPLRRNL
jgi:hypothetical protein